MKTSTEINSLAKHVGEEKAVELVAKAGFDAWDFSMFLMRDYPDRINEHPLVRADYLKFAKKLKQIGEDNGIECNQSHAPFPSRDPLIYTYLKRAIECTAEAGGKICIIHPDNRSIPKKNAEMYCDLLPFAKECGVKIAAENMWNWDQEKGHAVFAACATPKSFIEHLDAVGDKNFVACLDIGHAEMLGSDTNAVEMIKALGNRLEALHIHDNDKLGDLHQIPFSMKINFDEIVNALKEIKYGGYFTLEADQYLSGYTKENVFEGVLNLAESARKLAQKFENC